MQSATDGGWKKCGDRGLPHHSKQPEIAVKSHFWGWGGNGMFMMAFENLLLYQYYSNNFQRRQICQVNICIKPHIITTVRLKLLSGKPLRFM